MKEHSITEENIKTLVDTFYDEVRRDEQLGPVFDNAIGAHWSEHLQKMYDFWSSIMLRTRRFHGNPMEKHRRLPYFEPELFDTWLRIFYETSDSIFEPEISELFKLRSTNIARTLKAGIFASLPETAVVQVQKNSQKE